jgi:hypothetical protein
MTSAVNAEATSPSSLRWNWGLLRGRKFDSFFIAGVALLALTAGAASLRHPDFFPYLVYLDLWILGYHHVIATFTRLGFDWESFREHRFLVLWLPVMVAVGTVSLVLAFGAWVVPSVYLYWQWLHYMRQSYGISRIYQRKTTLYAAQDDPLTRWMLYLVSTAGIAFRSWQRPSTFLGMELRCLPMPRPLLLAIAAAAAVSVILWVAREIRSASSRGTVEAAYLAYLTSHLVIFTVGYFLIRDISIGWLVVNIWHNAQYLLIVWMYNNNRFKSGVDPRHKFLSRISQNGRGVLYFGACLAITSVVYTLLERGAGLLTTATLPVVLVIYQTINFHHYVVDSVIWKIRKKPLRERLGLAD